MRVYLIDGYSLLYRAFHALPQSIATTGGLPTNALYGFTSMVLKLLGESDGEEVGIGVAWDSGKPAFRLDIYPEYKAHRSSMPEELKVQLDHLDQILEAMNIPAIRAQGFEADDVLATLVARKPPEEQAAIVSGDRDLLALVRDPDIVLLFPVKGVSELTVFDESAVEEKYGVPPSLYPQFAILRGDSSDGLPGVAGIGPVRGVKLLREFGSVDAILENLATLPPKQALAFDQARDYLEAMKTVVGLVPDAEVEMTEAHQPNDDALHELGEIHGLKSSSARLARAVAGGSQGGAR